MQPRGASADPVSSQYALGRQAQREIHPSARPRADGARLLCRRALRLIPDRLRSIEEKSDFNHPAQLLFLRLCEHALMRAQTRSDTCVVDR
jgi:hypothetical protein